MRCTEQPSTSAAPAKPVCPLLNSGYFFSFNINMICEKIEFEHKKIDKLRRKPYHPPNVLYLLMKFIVAVVVVVMGTALTVVTYCQSED